MKTKLIIAVTLAALAASVLMFAAMRSGSPGHVAPSKTTAKPKHHTERPLIATATPVPASLVQLPAAAVAGTLARSSGGQLSSLPQYIYMGLDTAPIGRPAAVAVIDTAIAVNARALGGRVQLMRGNGAAGVNEHGTLIATAVTGAYSGVAMSNAGAATPAYVLFYGCALAGGIDLDCALSSVEAAATSGVRVINLSFETQVAIPAALAARWQVAVANAAAHGVIVVAAAGDNAGLPFPASVPGVVSVSRLRGKIVVNPAANAAAPGSSLVVVNGAGTLVATGGSSYSTAYVSAIAARVAAARPGISAEALRRAVSGRTTMPRAAKIAGIALAPVGRSRCVKIRRSGTRRVITWTPAAKALRYHVIVAGLPYVVAGRRLVTGRAGTVTVHGVGAYGTIGPAGYAC